MAEAADPLANAVEVFEAAGATVRVDPAAENLIRRVGEGWVVEAQGLPNLIHELVHYLAAGQLDDDHGFPYGQIPLALDRAEHRALLWEELSCCVLSCAYAPDPRAWFAEQIEILPVFYGDESLTEFRARVRQCVDTHKAEADLAFARARKSLSLALGSGFVEAPQFGVLWGP